jgi:hypothetical protein
VPHLADQALLLPPRVLPPPPPPWGAQWVPHATRTIYRSDRVTFALTPTKGRNGDWDSLCDSWLSLGLVSSPFCLAKSASAAIMASSSLHTYNSSRLQRGNIQCPRIFALSISLSLYLVAPPPTVALSPLPPPPPHPNPNLSHQHFFIQLAQLEPAGFLLPSPSPRRLSSSPHQHPLAILYAPSPTSALSR